VTGLEQAMRDLRCALDAPHTATWGWLVQLRMQCLQEALHANLLRADDAGPPSRHNSVTREHAELIRRLSRLSAEVAEFPAGEAVHGSLQRLLADLQRHRQRLNDLVYDGVSLELGGSG
jgi:hypothetical protein